MSKFIIIDKVYKAGCKLLKWLKIMDVENHESNRLYKYYPPMDYNFDALYNGYWFFSKFGHANDPFDCDLSLLDIIKNKWNLNSKDIDKEAIKNFAICSFSDSYLNKHLWALYSNGHTGFVVEYEYDDMQYMEFSNKGLPLPLFDVSYLSKEEIETTEEIPVKQLIPPLQDMPPARQKRQEMDNLFFFFYSIKEKQIWNEEHEKRLLIGRNRPSFQTDKFFIDCRCKNGYKVYFPIQLVKRIIAGMNISPDNLKRLKSIAKKYNVGVYKVVKERPFELRLVKTK